MNYTIIHKLFGSLSQKTQYLKKQVNLYSLKHIKKTMLASILIAMVLYIIKKYSLEKNIKRKSKFKKNKSTISVNKKINRIESFSLNSKKNYESHSDSPSEEEISCSRPTTMKKVIPQYCTQYCTDVDSDAMKIQKAHKENLQEKRDNFFFHFIGYLLKQQGKGKKQNKNSQSSQLSAFEKPNSHRKNSEVKFTEKLKNSVPQPMRKMSKASENKSSYNLRGRTFSYNQE